MQPATRPGPFAAGVMAAYMAACVAVLAMHHMDPSVTVDAGDRFVVAAQTHPALHVRANSDGYDGQFYYRLAVQPFSVAQRADGIAFDHPAKRFARIVYPLLVWGLTLGRAGLAAWGMLAVNILGLGAVAWLAADLARRLGLARGVPVAVMLWPGFIVSLLHDTTEIVAAAFLLAAVWAWVGRRIGVFAAMACCAVLTRETTLAAWLGMLVWRVADGVRARRWRWWELLACAAPVAVLGAWHGALGMMLDETVGQQATARDLDWPFAGAAEMLLACVTGTRHWAATPFKDAVLRAYVLCSAVPLLVFCGLVASRLRRAARWPGVGPVVAAWAGTMVLMSLLSAMGPWIDPAAYLRAFTECYVLGCLVLGASVAAWPRRWVAGLGTLQAGAAWLLCVVQLR